MFADIVRSKFLIIADLQSGKSKGGYGVAWHEKNKICPPTDPEPLFVESKNAAIHEEDGNLDDYDSECVEKG